MRKLLLKIVSLFAKNGIDLFELYVRRRYRLKIRSALVRKSKIRTDGVTIVANIFGQWSLPQVGRDFFSMMRATSIPCEVFDSAANIPFSTPPPQIAQSEQKKLRPFTSSRISQRNLLLFDHYGMAFPAHFRPLIPLFWEFESGLPEWRADLLREDFDVIACSDFLFHYYKRIMPERKIYKVRYPFSFSFTPTKPREETLCELGIPRGGNPFVVFFHFNYLSCCERKNPDGLIRAFAASGLADKKNAWLVVKTLGRDAEPEKAEKLARLAVQLGVRNIRFIDCALPRQEVLEAIAASSLYASLHRGEGFGIGMLEAMAAQTPVMATNYGGNTDFTTPNTSFLVDCTMTPAQLQNSLVYRNVRQWAEPNIETAAKWMKRLYDNPEEGQRKSKAATAFISDFFSADKFESDMQRIVQSR